MKASTEFTKPIHVEFNDVFTSIECFRETFSIQVKEEAKPYQALPRFVEYSLQKLIKMNWTD